MEDLRFTVTAYIMGGWLAFQDYFLVFVHIISYSIGPGGHVWFVVVWKANIKKPPLHN